MTEKHVGNFNELQIQFVIIHNFSCRSQWMFRIEQREGILLQRNAIAEKLNWHVNAKEKE